MSAATIAGIDTYNCTTAFTSPADEALFGLGCHPLDSCQSITRAVTRIWPLNILQVLSRCNAFNQRIRFDVG
jgi:hypothetical protein